MELKGNTVLVTGGSSGIGLQIARYLINRGNNVIICGRSFEKLDAAKKSIPSLEIFQCDVSVEDECKKLFTWIRQSFPDCNILINNAAIVHRSSFSSDDRILEKAELEIKTNYFGPIVLTKLFLPLLEKNPDPKIIYITTGLVYTPKAAYPVYSSTKAGLHSFVLTLRFQLRATNVSIIEVLMSVVDTPFHQGNPPKISITPEKAVNEMMNGLKKGKEEIRIGGVKLLYLISRIAPSFALKKINEL
ncbi:MAG: oxidoreductase [Marivirga sp.]|nr:oxidoreductase [Marivirga sp.]